jgi:hypothetical protein
MFLPRVFASAIVGTALVASSAYGEETTRAQVLFEDGIAAIARGDYAYALSRLDESERLEPSVGTLVKLSECEENLGKLVNARAHLEQAIELAERKDDARLEAVRERAARIDQITPKLRIVRPPASVAVTVDGASVASEAFDFPFAIDPGAHKVVAAAARKIPWRSDVRAQLDHTTVVVVPQLADAIAMTPPPARESAPVDAKEEPRKEANTPRTIGWVLGGAGLVGLGVGATFGILAIADKGAAHCDANDVCDPGTTSRMKSAATISDVGFIAGGALLASGVTLLLLTGDKDDEHPKAARLEIGPVPIADGAGILMGGAW